LPAFHTPQGDRILGEMLAALGANFRHHHRALGPLLARRGASSVVQQMVEFARSQAASDIDQGVDVLRSGLSMQPNAADSAGLLLAWAELEGERSNWPEVHSLAARASSAAAGSDEDLQAQAGAAATRALLAQGEGGEGAAGCTCLPPYPPAAAAVPAAASWRSAPKPGQPPCRRRP
jgi:hypothetical protein